MSATQSLLARSPLHHWHAARGGHFVVRNGWTIPEVYSSVEEEVAAARQGLGIVDLSPSHKVSLQGDGVPEAATVMLGGVRASQVSGVARVSAQRSVLACRLA